jgi:hypothetical protein
MKKTIINILTIQLQDMLTSIAELETIKAFLINFHGNRIKTLEKNLPKGMSIQIKGTDVFISLNNSNKSHLIGNTTDPQNLVDISEFESLNNGYIAGATKEIEKIKTILNDPEKLNAIVRAFTKWEKAYNKFKNLCIEFRASEITSFHTPGYFTILKTIGIPDHVVVNIQYDKYGPTTT